MKILTVNTSDSVGGAAIAAYRLHRGLVEQGVDAQMLSLRKASDDSTVVELDPPLVKILNRFRLLSKPDQLISRYYSGKHLIPFSASFFSAPGVLKKIRKINPDVVHIHWIHGGFLDPVTISKIDCPIVWSMHDMWVFTGGCQYNKGCQRYKVGCGACPVLKSCNHRDLSRWVFKRKQKAYAKMNKLTIIGLSRWLTYSARESLIFKDSTPHIVNLPNGIDTKVYQPINKNLAREKLNLPHDKKIVLFGAMHATSDKRKGFHLLKESIEISESFFNKDELELLVFGASSSSYEPTFSFPTSFAGRMREDAQLALLYNAADVMLVPSMEENLSNIILESMACGTPVVAFDIGGNPDMIDHKVNGYLAKPYDVQEFANGIRYVLQAGHLHTFSREARAKIEQTFDIRMVTKRYIELYKKVLSHTVK
ncbi:glycosyltransferase family 4 protein [Catalinimonas sp. 4WD22]|uniref:glycosyltransferase family 4 protein n=1 Tax=Catalinimonas locisalis TaxID=3133978 RepID=UPI003100B00A